MWMTPYFFGSRPDISFLAADMRKGQVTLVKVKRFTFLAVTNGDPLKHLNFQ